MDEIKPVKVRLDTEESNIRVYVLSDLHIGDPHCNIAKIKKVVEYIKNDKQMYVILLGDILNTALANSKSDIYGEMMNSGEARKLTTELLSPIKDRIVGMVGGNHESRMYREVGVDLSALLAESLGCLDKYSLGGILSVIEFGKNPQGHPYRVKIFGQHGSRGGRKLGGSMNALEDMDSIVVNADIYVMGHTHQNLQGGRTGYYVNDKGGIEKIYKYYFNAPAFLEYGGYGYEKGYKPGDTEPCYLNIRAYNVYNDKRNYKNTLKIDKVML